MILITFALIGLVQYATSAPLDFCTSLSAFKVGKCLGSQDDITNLQTDCYQSCVKAADSFNNICDSTLYTGG